MKPKLVLITHVENRAVVEGFIPAAKKLGYEVWLLTDHGLAHKQYFSGREMCPDHIIECDVFNPLAVIERLHTLDVFPYVVFSNSDHLQASTAMVAEYFSCPGKDWELCYQAKNKAAMRTKLLELNLPSVWSFSWCIGESLPENIPFPLVVKPREGVASMDVVLCRNLAELSAYAAKFGVSDSVILLESYLEGPLFTVETLGDGQHLCAIGGFDVSLSELPYFIETQASWNGPICTQYLEQSLAQIDDFGINFGVCHSEFILTKNGPVLVEINYRSIGDGREFLLNELLSFDWFEMILLLHSGESLPSLDTQTPHAIIRYFPAKQEGDIISCSGSFSLELLSHQVRYLSIKSIGDRIKISHSNKDYLGELILWGEDLASLEAAADTISQDLQWEFN
ncbi:ATP-grasp domain-containing protein [Shewanella sp. VB17]|uniref:ATP-grasp domain-containing protein n=1 Tax=Shewanella sp. VB17 TaxID=2739432 RepID=UPI0015676B23|nr:ATP-grasp domain-containing protein [Shewanella sp. VB17]NRD75568.1 ATP-grasp domain-containing protein [Shewanella sp. VB17]